MYSLLLTSIFNFVTDNENSMDMIVCQAPDNNFKDGHLIFSL